jgi:type IV pilus assembly protein PilF
MKPWWLWPVLALLLAGLSGCQQGGVRPSGGDSTGELGTLKGPSPADVYVNLAAEYLRDRQYSEALKNAKKATLVDPDSANAFTALGLVYQQIGEDAQADRAFRRALGNDGRNPYALNAYGSFLCAQRQYAEADEMFQRAVTNPLYQTPWVALSNAGICADDGGDPAQAEVYLRRALEQNPRFAPALLRMVDVSLQRDNPLSARAYLPRYEAVAEHSAESLWLGIQTERRLGDRDQVASYALLLRARFPDSQQVRLLNESGAP